MPELSPAARAVFESFNSKFEWIEDGVPSPQFSAIAAALRTAADQAEDVCSARPSTEWGEGWLEGVKDVVAGFRRIADQLEAQ